MPAAVAPALDQRTEGGHRASGVDDILRLEQAGDRGLADGERPKHQGAVEIDLSPGTSGAAGEAGRGAGNERFRHWRRAGVC